MRDLFFFCVIEKSDFVEMEKKKKSLPNICQINSYVIFI